MVIGSRSRLESKSRTKRFPDLWSDELLERQIRLHGPSGEGSRRVREVLHRSPGNGDGRPKAGEADRWGDVHPEIRQEQAGAELVPECSRAERELPGPSGVRDKAVFGIPEARQK